MPEAPWRNESVTVGCGMCGLPLSSQLRRWCSDACRQAAYRRRHQPAPEPAELPPAYAGIATTVYECDDCGERFVGTQRCETCNRFARRVGAGGHCPSCDEPVAVNELVEVSP